jgi:hypothetical protein
MSVNFAGGRRFLSLLFKYIAMTGMKKLAGLIIWAILFNVQAYSQVSYKNTYWGNTVEMTFSSADMSRPSGDDFATLRVSNVMNIGVTLNHDFGKALGIYTGVGVRNIGFIEKAALVDSTVKRRVYCAEIPVGIKIGSLYKRRYLVLGGGGDFAFNYKEKGFVKRGHKEKFNEWLSDRTPLFMPFAFVGFSFNPGLVLKLQYYPQNFLNTDYTDAKTSTKPYAGYNVNLLMLNLGVDIHHHKPPQQELQEATKAK